MLILPKSTEDLQVLMVEFLDCSWLSQDAVIEKGNTSVSAQLASCQPGHSIHIGHSPDDDGPTRHRKAVPTTGWASPFPFFLLGRPRKTLQDATQATSLASQISRNVNCRVKI